MSRHKIGAKVRVIHIDANSDAAASKCVAVGDTGVVDSHVNDPKSIDTVIVKLDNPRIAVVTHIQGVDDQFAPITKPPLLERIRRKFIKPSIDLTPGFKWEDMGWHPKDFIPEEETEKGQ